MIVIAFVAVLTYQDDMEWGNQGVRVDRSVVLTTILPILFLYLNTVTVTAGTFEP
jgi:hypothetical protein